MADSSIALRDTWLTRVLRAFKLVEVRPDGSTTHIAGADFADGRSRAPGMSAINSMSALAAFPWVQAAVSAVADDLSMLPIKVMRGRGANAEPLDDHPVLDLLEQPTSRNSGVMLRRQLITDLVLTGDAYLLVAGSPDPAALIRLHPERVRIVPSADGQAAAFDYQESGRTVRYSFEQVLHIRSTSWEDGPQGLYGTGAIRALANDLTTEKKAADLAANSADTGRPTGVFSPSEEGDRWNKQQVGVLRDAFDRQMKGTGGALFMGGPVKYEAIGWSPRDMEYQATRELVREAVIASIGVTPTRIGLPSANFATAREQNRIYWTSLQARAALVDSALTRLARLFRGSETVTVTHDFSAVEALQESRSDRQDRVQAWWLMGIPLAEAAALEGFEQVMPEAEEEDTAAPVAAGTSEQPVSAQALNGAQIASLLEILSAVSAGSITTAAAVQIILVAFPTIDEADARAIVAGALALPADDQQRAALEGLLHDRGIGTLDPLAKWLVLDGGGSDAERATYQAPRTEDGRAALWRSYIDEIHTPHERRAALELRRYLRGYGARVASRAKKHLPDIKAGAPTVTRALDEIALDKILDTVAEREILLGIFRPVMRSMLADAMAATGDRMPVDLSFAPERIDELVNAQLGQLVGTGPDVRSHVEQSTRDAVGKTIRTGLSEGQSIGQIQASLIKSRVFAPARALTIARTETTRAVSAGSLEAMREAEAQGVQIKKEWVSARDNHVRDSHKELDRQDPIGLDEQFTADGASADQPGDFGVGGLDINCRCAAVPFVVGVS